MIDKLLLNNQIITNKKKIQQARTQTINKLVQKIRKLKLLQEKKPQNEKITKNIEKIPKVLMVLKKFKVSDIIRKILTLNKKPTSILTNGQAAFDDVAIALLAENKIIAGVVETLKTLLSLNDSNPDWETEVLEVSRRKQKNLKSGGKKKKNKPIKTDITQAKVSPKKLPWKEENLETSILNENDTQIDALQPANGWKIEPVKESPIETSIPKTKTKNKIVIQPKSEAMINNVKDEEEKQSKNTKPMTVVDPFFFTDSGDNYLSTVIIDRIQPEPLQDGLIRRERRDHTFRPNKKNNIFRRQSAQNGFDGEFEKSKHFIKSGRIDKHKNFEVNTNAVSIDEKLHPSWAAKQKLKPAIAEFKGHKITFDNDGNNTENKSFKIKLEKSFSHKKQTTFEKYKNSGAKTNAVQIDKQIHPSWAAKQKLKPTIADFKGHKITFDTEGIQKTTKSFNNSTKPLSRQDKSIEASKEDLHPSWVAKQKQKPAITEFKGSKIKFDD